MKKIALIPLIFLSLTIHSAYADSCSARANVDNFYAIDKESTKYKIKFNVTSNDCKKYSCKGYVDYRIHFITETGTSSSKTTLVRYHINANESSTDITEQTYPMSYSTSVDVKDVDVLSVSCSTP